MKMQEVHSQQQQSQNHNDTPICCVIDQSAVNSTDIQQKRSSYGLDGIKGPQLNGGRFDFEDGGTYCGGWDDGKAHGHGVCTGPKHQGAYAGAWNYGFEVTGAYIWPSGSHYEGQWQNGRRHGLGIEQIGRQIYRGEWSKDGHKGRYGVRESTVSTAKYEGTWNLGYQDGYGCETYADGGKYQGQWQEGKRHGYGIRTSAPFGLASHYRRKDMHTSLSSLRSGENGDLEKLSGKVEEIRGGFVLTTKSDKLSTRRNSLSEKSKKSFLSGLKLRKQRSTGDLENRGTLASGSIRSTMSTASWLSTGSAQSSFTAKSTHSESNTSFAMEDEQLDSTVVETYMGEWKKDKRSGHGVAERSDGIKYEGEWYNNKKHGYGVTAFRDGTFEEGKYKNNILITSQKKKHLFLARSRKFRERISTAVNSAQRALKMAMQRSDIAISRTATASAKAQNADIAAEQARFDCEKAVQMAREFAPEFKPSVLERFEKLRLRERFKGLATEMLKIDNFAEVEMYSGRTVQRNLEQTNPKDTKFQESQSSVPNTMHAQQLPVTPQTDLSSQVDHPQQNYCSSGTVNKTYQQQLQQQYQNSHEIYPTCNFQHLQPPRISTALTRNNISDNLNLNDSSAETKNLVTKPNLNLSLNTIYNQSNKHTNNPPLINQIQQKELPLLQQQYPLILPIRNSVSINRLSKPQDSTQTSLYSKKASFLGEINEQSSIDYFDHYKQLPSRDSSIDRYSRAANRLSSDRQASLDHTHPAQHKNEKVNESNPHLSSTYTTTVSDPNTALLNKKKSAERAITPNFPDEAPSKTEELLFSAANRPFEEMLLRQRSLGQDIIPSPLPPKRTESLYLTTKPTSLSNTVIGSKATGRHKKIKSIPINVPLQRKKSLPDFQDLPRAADAMSREEVSALGSARREEVRRQTEINEMLKANPLLYLVSPKVKDWFSRQQMMFMVLFLNILLAILFVKMLT